MLLNLIERLRCALDRHRWSLFRIVEKDYMVRRCLTCGEKEVRPVTLERRYSA